jgi:2-dehydro-3-deoxyphosphogluconate aldolase/(4S)-4-hydroxy-2-oxoglutarate aldolase
MKAQDTLQHMIANRVVGIVRTATAEQAVALAKAFLVGGFQTLEITLTVPNALSVLSELAGDLPAGTILGAGTVLSVDQAKAAIDAGARFIVSPVSQLDLIPVCKQHGAVCIPAGMTPTELLAGFRAGAELVKVFPIENIGGVDYIRNLRGPLPELPLWVSGGVPPQHVPDYLQAGVKVVGLGLTRASQAMAAGDWEAVAGYAAEVYREQKGM